MFKAMHLYIRLLAIFLIVFMSGCAGIKSFPNSARPGETVAVAAGWKHDFSKDNITVTISPSAAAPVVYLPGDPAIRAIVNLYPDPLSSILVSTEVKKNLTPYAQTYANQVMLNFTNEDKDWWQTTVFIDLPVGLPAGAATIDISSASGESQSTAIEILTGTGQAEIFEAELNGQLYPNQLSAMERVAHYVVSVSGDTIPYAIELQLSHALDETHGGTGRAYVVNPRGDLKSTHWSDDGTNLKVMLVPAQLKLLSNMTEFKFYVAGGVNSLMVDSVAAFDIDGNQISGVVASLDTH